VPNSSSYFQTPLNAVVLIAFPFRYLLYRPTTIWPQKNGYIKVFRSSAWYCLDEIVYN